MKEMKDILNNGMLERYILGELDPSEHMEVEQAIRNNADLKRRLDEIEADLERVAMENAIAPPVEVKEQLLRQIDTAVTPGVRPLKSVQSKGNRYLAIAASLAVLFLLSTFWMYQKTNRLEQELQLVQQQKEDLLSDFDEVLASYEQQASWYELINDPETEKLLLKGNERSPETLTASYINHSRQVVVVNTRGLPELSGDQDYQLWADVDGEMIDMGVIQKDQELAMMSYIQDAESLNITIEPKGGSEHPTVSNLISAVSL